MTDPPTPPAWSRQIGFQTLAAEIQCLDYSPDGAYLAVSFAPRAENCQKVSVLDTRRYHTIATFDANQRAIDRIAFSPDAARLVTVSAGQVFKSYSP